MQKMLIGMGVSLTCLAFMGLGRVQAAESMNQGLFSGQSVTLTLGSENIAPFLQEKGFAVGDTIRLTHNGNGRLRVERLAPGSTLRLAIAATDYLSARQVSEMLDALGLAAEAPVICLVKGDTLTATVTEAGGDASALLGRRGFATGDRVSLSNIGDRFKIEALDSNSGAAIIVSISSYLPAAALQELAGAFGQAAPVPATADPALPTPSAVPASPEVEAEIAQAQAEFEQDILEANEGQVVAAVDFRQLKALLPESLPGLERLDASGERMQMMGANVATAHGRYAKSGDENTNIEIEIMDLGSLSGFMRQAMVSWTGQSFNNTTAHGYVKTTEYRGHSGLEEWDSERQIAMLQLHVAGRFLVSIEGDQVTMDAIHGAADLIDLEQLVALATASAATAAPTSAEEPATSFQTDVTDVEARLAQMEQAGTSQPVDEETLKSCLPATAAGFKRTDLTGQKLAMSGITMVNAEARYEGNASKAIAITIMDTAQMGPEMRMGMAAWNMLDFDSETDTGYERTTTFGPYRAMETLDRTVPEVSISIFVGNRFYTTVAGTNVSIEKARQALGEVNLQKLAALATP